MNNRRTAGIPPSRSIFSGFEEGLIVYNQPLLNGGLVHRGIVDFVVVLSNYDQIIPFCRISPMGGLRMARELDGLIPMTALSWKHVWHPNDFPTRSGGGVK